MEGTIASPGLPEGLVEAVVALIVSMPEGLASILEAKRSIDLALGTSA